MKRWVTSMAVAGVSTWGVVSAAEENPEPLIARLADDSFSAREQAAAEILTLAKSQPSDVQTALVEAHHRSPEPEIRYRSKDLLMKIFTSSVGYVGVRYGADNFVDKQGNVRRGVRIIWIEPGSPAESAGILPMDVIVALNGVALDPQEPDKDFATRVQLVGVGNAATVKLFRGTDEMDFKITLAARTLPMTADQASALFKARLLALEKKPAARD